MTQQITQNIINGIIPKHGNIIHLPLLTYIWIQYIPFLELCIIQGIEIQSLLHLIPL